MRKKTLEDLSGEAVEGRSVLVRVDFNVPLDDAGQVGDPTRIERSLPTIRRLASQGARVILLSHLGRPGGSPDPALSLRPVATALRERLRAPVAFCEETVGSEATEAVEGLEDGDVLLLENTRFLPGETENDLDTARRMAALGEAYVNDAFGTAHRAHASTEGVPRLIREGGGEAVAGLLMERELRFLDQGLRDPRRPFLALLGGAKISGKIDVIHALLPRVDQILIGGAMANTFFRALGLETGDSLVEEDRIEMAVALLEEAEEKIVLPVDVVVASEISADADATVRERSEVEPGERIGDIGPTSREIFAGALGDAGTVVWNGPMGVFELEPFAQGTLAVARAVARATDRGALTVVGGGDSASAVEAAGVGKRVSHVSTGGGASLELLAGAELPGVAALSDVDP